MCLTPQEGLVSSPYERVLQLVSTLSYADVKQLHAVLTTQLEEGYLPAQGSLDFRFITRNGKRYGPYKYRRRWLGGKLIDHYEGKATPEEYQAWLDHKASQPSAHQPAP
jgi:hypothetical protein